MCKTRSVFFSPEARVAHGARPMTLVLNVFSLLLKLTWFLARGIFTGHWSFFALESVVKMTNLDSGSGCRARPMTLVLNLGLFSFLI